MVMTHCLTSRSDIAIFMNYRLIPVITCNLDQQDGDHCLTFNKVKYEYQSKNHGTMLLDAEVVQYNDGNIKIESSGTMLKNSFTISDIEELAQGTTASLLKPSQLVAVLKYSKTGGFASIKISRTSDRFNPNCYEIGNIKDCTDDEFQNLIAKIREIYNA